MNKEASKVRRCFLSPIDRVFLGEGAYPIQFLFRFDGKLDPKRVSDSLQSLRNTFWPLIGQVVETPENFGIEVQYDDGFLLEINNRESENFETISRERTLEFERPIVFRPGEDPIKLELHQFSNASLLNVSMAHSLADGFSFFLFLSEWARRCRTGDDSNILLSSLDHSRNLPRTEANKQSSLESDSEISQRAFESVGFQFADPRNAFRLSDIEEEHLEISRTSLLEEAGGISHPRDAEVNWNDLLCAKLILISGERWPTSQLQLGSIIDARQLSDEVSKLYFGNAVRGAGVGFNKDELEERNLLTLARKIHEQISLIDGQACADAFQFLEELWKARGVAGMERLHVSHPQTGLLVTNLSNLPIKRLDFGQGPPTEVAPLTPAPRSAMVASIKGGFHVRLSGPLNSI